MEIKTNAASELKTANELLDVFERIESKADELKQKIGFYTTKDVCELTGLSMPKVLDIFSRPDFPVCDYGHGKIVFVPAFCNYFMKPVKQSDFK